MAYLNFVLWHLCGINDIFLCQKGTKVRRYEGARVRRCEGTKVRGYEGAKDGGTEARRITKIMKSL